MIHAILGANGVIGRQISMELSGRADGAGAVPRVRQVSRSPRRVNPTDEPVPADLLDPRAADDAVKGSDIAYLVAGLPYRTAVWREQWPRIMQNVIAACGRHRCRLVFFDNVYAYGLVRGPMTEDTPFNPVSRKGDVRARVASMLLSAMRAGDLEAMIVRSADFYGPGAGLAFTQQAVFEPLRRNRSPRWIGAPAAEHSFTYTVDAGRACAELGSRDAAYGHTWHAPTRNDRMTGEQFVRLACSAAGQAFRLQAAPRLMLRLMGFVIPLLRENAEMMYQFEQPYRFDSSRAAARFGL